MIGTWVRDRIITGLESRIPCREADRLEGIVRENSDMTRSDVRQGRRTTTHARDRIRLDADQARLGRRALAFTVAVVVAQILFLTVGCDWELCGDEAEF